MRGLTVISGLVLVAAIAAPTPVARGATTVTLQQGTDGYAGCADSFIDSYAPNSNYDQSGYLRLKYYEQSG